MTPPALNLSISILPPDEKKRYQVVKFHGELDKAGLLSIRERIDELVERFTGQYLAFDLSELDFINSESIGFLTTVHAHLIKTGKSLVILQARENVKDVFTVIGLFSIMNYFDNLPEFVNTLTVTG